MNKKNIKILLVEDDKFISEMYFQKLSTGGFDVKIAENGEDGINFFGDFDPDLVLLDIVLPKKSGWDVLKEINKFKKNKPNRKILMLTNLSDKEKIDEAFKNGADGYFVKASLTPADLLRAVEEEMSD